MHSANKDFFPKESIAFQKMISTLGASFETFGFIPHSTPAISDLALMREQTGMKDIYEVVDPTGNLQGMGLKVDHTVSLVQFVVKHRDKLVFPFKRYTTQKVFRPKGEGGFTEFYSCDIDTVSENHLSLIYDAEIVALIKYALVAIGLNNVKTSFKININNKRAVNGFFKQLGVEAATDKAEADSRLKQLMANIVEIDSNMEKLSMLASLATDAEAVKGVKELADVYHNIIRLGVPDNLLNINPVMTRDMHYYTGTIYRTLLTSYPEIGSICHGGRYNIATEEGINDFYGVGVTIHLTQLFYCLIEHGLLPYDKSSVAEVLVSGIGSLEHAMYIASRLRDEYRIKSELFLDQTMEIGKQIEYAKKRGFKLVIWTDQELGCKIKADDLVNVQRIDIPDIPRKYVFWGVFDSIKIIVG